ncbi:hypothetical protein E4U42_005243 [Claviceps africana]|uniref:Apopolysialoglycoprotein n=1 Tax=Claviceps africana TaxID=83212 RepID=A0A8K0J4Z4_9HYPO|nr:hypothetical protein E4U42_005243 [Claviceps africana]
MAPGTRRANRSGYAEHDDFEGLPVRQWRQDWVNIAPPQAQEQIQPNDQWSIELFHGMPKDFNLLAPHSQELLRAARSGRLYKRPAPPEDEEADTDVAVTEKVEKKEEDSVSQGFSIRLWKQIPRNNEGSGLSHLAKRRKGTVTIASKTVDENATTVPTVTRATVRRTDAAGNPYTEEVTLADGQQVVGEIISTRLEAAPTAAADGFVAPAPVQKKRPPPPKRRSKAGPGRGKKKHKYAMSGQALAAGVARTAGGVQSGLAHGPEGTGTSLEGKGTFNAEIEMGDGDEDDDEDEGDDGDDGDDNDQQEGDPQLDHADDSKIHDEEMADAVDERRPPTPSRQAVDAVNGTMTQTDLVPPNPVAPALAPTVASLGTHSPKNEGSPLKNVMLQSLSPTDSPPASSIPTDAAELVSSAPVVDPVVDPAALPAQLPAQLPAGGSLNNEIAGNGPSTESLIAEPSSEAAGNEGAPAADEDVTMTEAVLIATISTDEAPAGQSKNDMLYEGTRSDKSQFFPDVPSRVEALLPPPPEQVGNISSPRGYDGTCRESDSGDKARDGPTYGEHLPMVNACDSVMTGDTIKPEDSASVRFPLTESGAPSEIGMASAEEVKNPMPAEASRAASPPRSAASVAEEAEIDTTAAADEVVSSVAAVESDEQKVSDETQRDSSWSPSRPVAPGPVSSDFSPAVEPKQSPAATRPKPDPEPRDSTLTSTSTSTQVVHQDEQLFPISAEAVQDSLHAHDPPHPQTVAAVEEESMSGGAVKAEPMPETQPQVPELANPSADEDAKREWEEQRDTPAPVAGGNQDALAEGKYSPTGGSKPQTPEPEPVSDAATRATAQPPDDEAFMTRDEDGVAPAPAPAPGSVPLPSLPPVLPTLYPAVLPPIAAAVDEHHDAADGPDEKKEDAPAGA